MANQQFGQPDKQNWQKINDLANKINNLTGQINKLDETGRKFFGRPVKQFDKINKLVEK
jgi:hypothetical protein